MKINLQQNTPEWLNFRYDKIGGSDISAILGINPWKSAYQLWKEKVTHKKIEDNENMKHGRETEEEAREFYNKKFKQQMTSAVYTYDNWDVAMASVDGISKDGTRILEIKCPVKKLDSIEGFYLAQCQWNMMVSGASICDLIYYWKDGTYLHFDIQKDKSSQDMMLRKAKEFRKEWEASIKTDGKLLAHGYLFQQNHEKLKKLEQEKKELRDLILKECTGMFAKVGDIYIRKGVSIRKKLDSEKLCTDYGIGEEEFDSYYKNISKTSYYLSCE